MDKLLTPDFWAFYDLATEQAVKNPEWNDLEARVRDYLNKAPNCSDLESNLVNLLDQQYNLLMAELFKMLRYR